MQFPDAEKPGTSQPSLQCKREGNDNEKQNYCDFNELFHYIRN